MRDPPKSASGRNRAKMKIENPERYEAYLQRNRIRRMMKKEQLERNQICQKMKRKELNMEKMASPSNSAGRMKLNMIHVIQSLATRIPVLKLRRIDETQQQHVPVTENLVKGSGINLRQGFRRDCEICEISFWSKSSFDTHLQECIKMKSEPLPTYLGMVEHHEVVNDFEVYIKTIIKVTKFSCPVCSEQFKSKILMLRHLESHNTHVSYRCTSCNKTFTQRLDYLRHVKQHTNKMFQCTICNDSFWKKEVVIIHVGKHLGIKPYACHVCHKTYTTKGHLREHVATHSGYKPFQCDFCSERFYMVYRLNSHKRNKHNIY